ncbi:hypothetical protein ZWY2020_010605 [Hordeum vulgare]|nr:hypothetical protein ZWY2020_010605 [Hordeum vulgare]
MELPTRSHEETWKMLDDCMAIHGKTYDSDTEFARRFIRFKINLVRVHRHNNAAFVSFSPYRLSLDRFADLHYHEFLTRCQLPQALLSTARRCCLSPPPRRPATQLTWPPLRQRTSPSHHGGSRPDLNQPPPDSSSDLGRRHPSTLGHDDELQDQSLTLVWLTTQQQQQLGTVVGRRAGGSGIRCRHPFVQKGRQHPSPHQSACANAKKKMSDAALSAAQWVVGKALAPVADGLLGAWAATNNFGPNVEALSTELLLVKATLEQASLKELGGRAMEMLLQKLRDSAHNAEDLLDELDYFRIHDELHNTDDAAGEHGKGYIRDLAFNARHTAKAVGKQVNCCPWQRAKHRQSSQGDSSSATDANQEVSGCMPNLIGKLLPCSSSPHPHVSADEEDHGNAQQTPKLDFNRVHFSQRMKDIVEKLQPVRKDVNEILQGCGARIALDIAQHRPTTTPQSAEPKLYGRDRVMNSIIDDITEGQYCDKGLTVLPVVGPGGMGKTTLIQHIYHNQQVQNHFPVRIWICVSFNFNLDKVLEQIKRDTLPVEGLEINGEGDLHNIDQVLVFDKETGLERLTLDKCPPLELKHLLMLTSLNRLIVRSSVGLVGPLGGGESDVEWQLPVEHIWISGLNGNSGEELTELLPHLPNLSRLEIWNCKNMKKLVVGVDVQQTTLEGSDMEGGEITAAAEEEDGGVLLFPPHLCDSLLELEFRGCHELVLVDPPTLVPGGGGLQALRSLQRLRIQGSPKFLSTFSFSCHIFPSSLQFLGLWEVEGMGTLEPLSNLTSLTRLILRGCGEDLKRQGLLSLLTTGGQLKELRVMGSPRFFADWDPNPRRALEVAEGSEEQQTQLVSSTLRELWTEDIAGLLAAPFFRFLSPSLTKLILYGYYYDGMERFSKEQEDALQLLSTLQELEFWDFQYLQQLPAGLRNLTSLKILSVRLCPAISSLPNDALSDSLKQLNVYKCTKELEQYCRGLEGTKGFAFEFYSTLF